jgi:hypothetical protein
MDDRLSRRGFFGTMGALAPVAQSALSAQSNDAQKQKAALRRNSMEPAFSAEQISNAVANFVMPRMV